MEIKARTYSLLVFIAGCMFCYSANANIVNNLYSIETIVSDDSAETRYQFLPQALDLIILKVAGATPELDHQALVEATEHIDKYITNYSYSSESGFYILSIHFNQKLIDQLLTKMGMASKITMLPAAKINNGVTLRVSGIKNVEDYARIMDYLKNLAVSKRVELTSVLADRATFIVTADGGKDAVNGAIGPDSMLISNFSSEKDLDGLSYKVAQ